GKRKRGRLFPKKQESLRLFGALSGDAFFERHRLCRVEAWLPSIGRGKDPTGRNLPSDMEGFVEGDDPGDTPPPSAVTASTAAAPGSNSRRVTTRAGTGTAASLAGMVAARSSGAADGISPVHGAYGLAIEEEVEDLLSSHMKFMQRSSPSSGSGSSQRSG
ncbi:unnamed protein product, partial [Ectocarpus sp. 12 AP-2014]